MAVMSYEDWLRSQGYTYTPGIAGKDTGQGDTYSGLGLATNSGRSSSSGQSIPSVSQIPSKQLNDLYRGYVSTAIYQRVPYSGGAVSPSGRYEIYREADEDRPAIYVDTGSKQLFTKRYDEDNGMVFRPLGSGGEDSEDRYIWGDKEQYLSDANLASQFYSRGYVPWNIDNIYEGLSSRQPFNLNALWGGTQYAAGRVTDWSHIDPTQYKANVIAANTRNQLWNEYDRLKAQGKTPAKNPDEVALDFYVKNVGQNGSSLGYGPGVNTALLSEALKNTFLNQPEVVSARGARYTTSQAQIDVANQFGSEHEAGVPIWQVFERQGMGGGGFGRFIPLIIGAIVFPGMGAALAQAMGGTIAANIAAASIIGGLTAEINGGDFLDGAIKSALTAGTGAALANVGVAAEVSSALESVGFDANLANKVADTAERAVTAAIVAEATGGDAAAALANTLVAAGVSAVRGEVTDIVNNITAGTAPSDIEDAEIGAAMAETATQPQETAIVAPQQPEDVSRETSENLMLADVSGLNKTTLDVRGSPLYAGAEGSESVTGIPDGMRLATYEEANEMAAQGIPAETLPDGTIAFIVPETQPAAKADAEFLPEFDLFGGETAPTPEAKVDFSLPEEQPIPETMPEVEPEPVLPKESQAREGAGTGEEPATGEGTASGEGEGTGEGGIGDQEVLDALAEEGAGEEAAPEEDIGEEVAPEGEEVLPTEEEPEEEPGTEREPTEGPSSLDKLIASLLLSERGGGAGAGASAPRRSVTQESISPREISGSVTGIIGKKQPMFSGDEDEQSAEWNRRSLRLRKVLGL